MLKEHKEFIFGYLKDYFPSIVEPEKNRKFIGDIQICLNLAIKYSVDKKDSSLIRLKNNVQLLYELDRDIYENWLEKIEDCSQQ